MSHITVLTQWTLDMSGLTDYFLANHRVSIYRSYNNEQCLFDRKYLSLRSVDKSVKNSFLWNSFSLIYHPSLWQIYHINQILLIILFSLPYKMIEKLSHSTILFAQIIRQLQLLPLTAEAVEHKVKTFRNYTDEVSVAKKGTSTYLTQNAGLSGSVGCAFRLETRRSRVQPPPRSATFFQGDWSWNIFYSHSLPSADSRKAVVSFWRKNVHNTG